MGTSMVEWNTAKRTYLRVRGELFPVYGDVMRGYSPLAQDVRALAESGYRYASVDELYFALVNLCVARGDGS